MVISAFLIKIAQSLGLYAAEKALDVTVDTALEHKENKRNKASSMISRKPFMEPIPFCMV